MPNLDASFSSSRQTGDFGAAMSASLPAKTAPASTASVLILTAVSNSPIVRDDILVFPSDQNRVSDASFQYPL